MSAGLHPEALADDSIMAAALRLARRGLGIVAPNPAVGCILVKDGRILARGWTQRGGRPHAETEALRRAGPAARGATAYVTLEPCAHHGETPPCTDALIAAGVARVVVTLEDPDPRVCGRGFRALRAAGVAVTSGVGAAEAVALNRGFFLRIKEKRPLVTLKMATSVDGRIATASGESRWISGERARAFAHRLRASHDAILVGSGTVLADDPMLDCRLPGMADRSPIRVVADARLRLPMTAQVVRTAREHPTWVLTAVDADCERRQALAGEGVHVIVVAAADGGGLVPRAMAEALAGRGITRVLIEGGGRLAAGFLKARLIDEIAWVHAPVLLGADGVPGIASLTIDALLDAPRLCPLAVERVGGDVLTLFRTGK